MRQIARCLPGVTLLFAALPLYSRPPSETSPGWDTGKLGNHRAVVRVSEAADAVLVRIPWRRRDSSPESRRLLVVDSTSGTQIRNVFRSSISRAAGEIVFQPSAGAGDYYVYYLPFVMSGRENYPTVEYPPPEETAETGWLERNGLAAETTGILEEFPRATFLTLESIDSFNHFEPMEWIATQEEVDELVNANAGMSYLLFPETRDHPIRMTKDLPLRWVRQGAGKAVRGTAARGEFYVFQIGVFPFRKAIEDLQVDFSELAGREGRSRIPASSLRCFNTGGVDWLGRPFTRQIQVPRGHVQALWMGVDIPRDVSPDTYVGELFIRPSGETPQTIPLFLEVVDEELSDHGDSEPWKHSRLRWLDSRIADDESVVSPFVPVRREGSRLHCLGRQVNVAATGLPSEIWSYFSREMTHLNDDGRNILAGPVRFVVKGADGQEVPIEQGLLRFLDRSEGRISWAVTNRSGPLSFELAGTFEFDGTMEFEVRVTSTSSTDVEDIGLEIPIRRNIARYMMGLGRKGGLRPQSLGWKWDPTQNQDSVWLGDVNAGLQASFKAENYSRPLNTNFYLLKPLQMPPSWHNEGRGRIRLREEGETVLLFASGGKRVIAPDETLHFNFRLTVTPFKLLDTETHFQTRYYHRYAPLDEILQRGANTVNVHHANEINPYINYPFLRTQEMKSYVDEAREKGLKVKIYYTVRELTNRAPEIFALRSLGDEILSKGPGGGPPWLQEHLGEDYIAGWYVPELEDSAVVNSGVSRWHNYYLEGLDWLVRNVGIDGLYIDDVAFDRHVMKRVRRILDRNRPDAMIDLHSANQFNPRDGFANSANLYLEHFPYLDRLWFGEYFDYNSNPDFWLVEVSGIPFGLMGEMLQDGGNPWRGMLYGMTARLPWAGDPSFLWKVWDSFGISESRMVGYWVDSNPIQTSHPEILATAYVKQGDSTLISLGSWAREKVNCRLRIDWEQLGLNSHTAELWAPEIPHFQSGSLFDPAREIPVEPGKGWLLIARNRD